MKDDRLKKYEVSWWIKKDGYGYGDSFDSYEEEFALYREMFVKGVFLVKLQKTVQVASNDNDYHEETKKI